MHKEALGDLQDQRAGVKVGVAQRSGDVIDQPGILELANRQVDADREPALHRLLPLPGLLTGLFEYPAADGDDASAPAPPTR